MSDFAANAAISRISMNVVAVAPHDLNAIAANIQAMAATNVQSADISFAARMAELCDAYGMPSEKQEKSFAFSNGVAIIPVTGTLLNRFNRSYGFVTGYNFIRSQLRAALADEDVKMIAFDLNSPGGEAAGCFELANEIRESRAVKPSIGVVDSNCYSACYAIGSACTKLVATPSSGVGSIGVIMMHVSISSMLEKAGVKVELIYEGERKADGNPFEDLPVDVRKNFKARIHSMYTQFTELVADNLGIDVKTVVDTKSATFTSEDALSLGLIHAIATPQTAVQAFFDELSGSTPNLRTGGNMPSATQNQEPGAGETAATTTTQPAATVDATKVAADARVAERERVSAITGCEEAKGREALASHLAFKTSMSADEAKVILNASTPATQTSPANGDEANHFETAMNNSQHPAVGASTGTEGAAADPDADAAKGIMGAFKAVSGRDLA